MGPAALAAISAKGQRTAGKAGVTSGGSTSSAAQQAQLRALVQRAMADVAKMASNPAGAAATVQQINSMLQQAQQAGGGNAQGAAIVQQLGRLLQRARAEEASGVSSGA
ncbi:MAG: hypothetical protein ACRDHX_10440 [Chloroflexota bacterium]